MKIGQPRLQMFPSQGFPHFPFLPEVLLAARVNSAVASWLSQARALRNQSSNPTNRILSWNLPSFYGLPSGGDSPSAQVQGLCGSPLSGQLTFLGILVEPLGADAFPFPYASLSKLAEVSRLWISSLAGRFFQSQLFYS